MKLDKILGKQAELINEAKRLIGISQKEEFTAEQKKLIEKYAFLTKLKVDLVYIDSEPEPEWLRAMAEGIEREYGKDIDSWYLEEMKKVSNELEEVFLLNN